MYFSPPESLFQKLRPALLMWLKKDVGKQLCFIISEVVHTYFSQDCFPSSALGQVNSSLQIIHLDVRNIFQDLHKHSS